MAHDKISFMYNVENVTWFVFLKSFRCMTLSNEIWMEGFELDKKWQGCEACKMQLWSIMNLSSEGDFWMMECCGTNFCSSVLCWHWWHSKTNDYIGLGVFFISWIHWWILVVHMSNDILRMIWINMMSTMCWG